MDFLNKFVNLFTRLYSSTSEIVTQRIGKRSKKNSTLSRRHLLPKNLRLESLEARELLAASILDLSAYASPTKDGKFTFDLATYQNEAIVLDITAVSQGSLDPGKIRIFGEGNREITALSLSTASTTDSIGRFRLESGTYTIIVEAENGTLGNFNCSMAVADVTENMVTYKSSFEDLVHAAIEQQNFYGNWGDYVTQMYPHLAKEYGSVIYTDNLLGMFPEIDQNGNGIADTGDATLAEIIAGTKQQRYANVTSDPTVTTPAVTDNEGPAISVALKNDTGKSAADKLTTDPTLSVTVTDPHTVKKLQVSADGKTFYEITVQSSGQYTLTEADLLNIFKTTKLDGKYQLTFSATDGLGNVSSLKYDFTVAAPLVGKNEQTAPTDHRTESITLTVFDKPAGSTGAAITKINGQKVVNNRVDLEGLGYVIVNGNKATYYPNGQFADLGKLETKNVALTFTVEDNAGNKITPKKTVVLTGSNQRPTLNNTQAVKGNADENNPAVISRDKLVQQWKDKDGDTLTPTRFAVDSVTGTAAQKAVFTAEFLNGCIQWQNGTLTFDTSDPLFQKLGADESIVVRLSYKVTDGEVESNEFGFIDITIKGFNQAPTATTPSVALPSATTDETVSPKVKDLLKQYGIKDVDMNDTGQHYIQSVVAASGCPEGILLDVQTTDGKVTGITITAGDALKNALRETESETGKFTVTIADAHGGTVTVELIVELTGVVDSFDVRPNSPLFVETNDLDKAWFAEEYPGETVPQYTLWIPKEVANQSPFPLKNLVQLIGVRDGDTVTYTMTPAYDFLKSDDEGGLIADYNYKVETPYLQKLTVTLNAGAGNEETVEFVFIVNMEEIEITKETNVGFELSGNAEAPKKIVAAPPAKSGAFRISEQASTLTGKSLTYGGETYEGNTYNGETFVWPTLVEGEDYILDIDDDGNVSLQWLSLDKLKFLPEGVTANFELSFQLESDVFQFSDTMTISVTGVNDEADLTSKSYTGNLNIRDADGNINIGKLEVVDPDLGATQDTYTFALSGENASLFTLSADGRLSIAAGTEIAPGEYTLTVLLTDSAEHEQEVTITVTLEGVAAPVLDHEELDSFTEDNADGGSILVGIAVPGSAYDLSSVNPTVTGYTATIWTWDGKAWTNPQTVTLGDGGVFAYDYTDGNLTLSYDGAPFGILGSNQKLALTFDFDIAIDLEIDDLGNRLVVAGSDSLEVTILGVNDAPVLDVVSKQVDEKGSLTFGPEVARDPNGESVTIGGVKVGDTTIAVGETKQLADGTWITLDAEGHVTVDLKDRIVNLRENQTDTLILTLTLADEQGLESTADLTVTINGVNETPVVGHVPSLELQINGHQVGQPIKVGTISVTDPDGDLIGRTADAVVYYTDPVSGEPVALPAKAYVTEDGDIMVVLTAYPEIEPGTSLDCWFTVTFDDRHTDGQVDVRFELALSAAPGPNVIVSGPENTTFHETDKKKDVVYDITVTDGNGERSGNDWYTVDNLTRSAARGDSQYDFSNLFNTNKDGLASLVLTESGWQLKFEPRPVGLFNFLNPDETLTLTFTFDVTDTENSTVTSKSVTITILGENTLPTFNDSRMNELDKTIGEKNGPESFHVLGIWTDADSAHGKQKQDWSIVGKDGVSVPVVVVKSVNGTDKFEVGQAFENLVTITFLKNGVPQITFDPGTTFEGLGEGASIVLEIEYRVIDPSGGVSTKTATLEVTVTGENDSPEITADALYEVVWSGRQAGDTATVGQVGMHDAEDGSAVTPTVGDTVEYWNGEEWIATGDITFVVAEDGTISATFHSDLGLKNGQSRRYRFQLTATDSDGASVTETIEIDVTTLLNPAIDKIEITVSESAAETAERQVDASITDPNGRDIDDWYVLGKSLNYNNTNRVSVSNPSGTDYSEILANFDWSDCFEWTNGTFRFHPNGHFDFLNEGDSVTITFKYKVADKEHADVFTWGDIIVTITGEDSKPAYTGSSEGQTPSVAADSETGIDLQPLDDWSDPDLGQDATKDRWNVIPGTEDGGFTAIIDGRSDSMNDTAAFDDHFTVGSVYDGLVTFADGKLTFVPGDAFLGLRAGDHVDLTIAYRVVDASGTVSEVHYLTVRVEGVNDPMTVVEETTSFETVTASRNDNGPKTFDPQFTVNDGNIGENPQFAITDVIADGTGLNFWNKLKAEQQASLFTMDPVTGVITMNGELLDKLPKGKSLTFTLSVEITNASGESVTKEIVVSVTSPKAPKIAANGDREISENGQEIRISLDALVRDQNLPKRTGADWFTIADVAAHVDGFEIEGTWWFDETTREIVFQPNDAFESLADGSSAAITFTFTVIDNDYDRETTGSLTLTVLGENDAPVLQHEGKADIGRVTVGGAPVVINIADLASDVDQGDQIRLTAINGQNFDVNGELTINGVGRFVYDADAGTLTYYAEDDDLAADFFGQIGVNRPVAIDFTFTIEDLLGASVTGDATVTVVGVNAQPQINATEYEVNDASTITIRAKDIATDRNASDILTFLRVGGIDVRPGTTIFAENGITITFNETMTEMYIHRPRLLETVYETLDGERVAGTYESLMLSIFVQDDSGTENAVSDLGNVMFIIKGTGAVNPITPPGNGGETNPAAPSEDDDDDQTPTTPPGDDNDKKPSTPSEDDDDDKQPTTPPGDNDDDLSPPAPSELPTIDDQAFEGELASNNKKLVLGTVLIDGTSDEYHLAFISKSFTRDGLQIKNPGFNLQADGTLVIPARLIDGFVEGTYSFTVRVSNSGDPGVFTETTITVILSRPDAEPLFVPFVATTLPITDIASLLKKQEIPEESPQSQPVQQATDAAFIAFAESEDDPFEDMFQADYSNEIRQFKLVESSETENEVDQAFAELFDEEMRSAA